MYILECGDGSFYTGHTDDIENRMAQHHTNDISCYTSGRQPVHLVFLEEFSTREEALARERQVKGWSRKKKQALMRGDWDEISKLAKGKISNQA